MAKRYDIGFRKAVITALLAAILLVMWLFPFIGYIQIVPGVSITLMMIPVAVGAMILGPYHGLILGTVFGLTSYLTCFGIPAADALGPVILQENAFLTAVLCILPRAVMGLLCGLIFKGLKKIDKTKIVSYAVTGLSAALINTVLFVSLLILFFYGRGTLSVLGDSVWGIITVLITANALVEAAVSMVVSGAVAKAIDSQRHKLFK